MPLSAVRSILRELENDCAVSVGGRFSSNWKDYIEKASPSLSSLLNEKVQFVSIDINDEEQLHKIIPKYDLIIHTAGPFQGLKENKCLQYALHYGRKYLDVCDDIFLSRVVRASEYQDIAKNTGGIGIISTGIWPGCSSLLAQQLIEHHCDSGMHV